MKKENDKLRLLLLHKLIQQTIEKKKNWQTV